MRPVAVIVSGINSERLVPLSSLHNVMVSQNVLGRALVKSVSLMLFFAIVEISIPDIKMGIFASEVVKSQGWVCYFLALVFQQA